ncbi:hypothetical protein ABH944_003418 [Caballeronia udeis]|uniref:Uncharacterized protein n=1 Tax=Caballeronia udeis TaxID=1232866 RepID=A0ABW8MKH6_9BURK
MNEMLAAELLYKRKIVTQITLASAETSDTAFNESCRELQT